MLITHDVLHAVQPAREQVAQHHTPALRTHRIPEPAAELFPVAVGAHADDPGRGGRQHLPFAPDALIVRIDDQLRHRCASSRRARQSVSVASKRFVALLTSEALTVSPQRVSTTCRTLRVDTPCR